MAKKVKKRKRGSGRQSRGSGGGIFSSMRGGMKSMVGTGGKKVKKKRPITFWDVLFWTVAAFLGAVVVYRWLT